MEGMYPLARWHGKFTLAAALLSGLFVWPCESARAGEQNFPGSIRPSLAKTCFGCHTGAQPSGGLNLDALASSDSVAHRDQWEAVLEKLRGGQMPPPGIPRPAAADLRDMMDRITNELARLDRLVKPDPGHITARRLNRTEYDNSVRDLLGVEFQPAADFPPDDTGYGFDDIGDVLSLSPSLMEKYVSAAEKVARTALYGPPTMQPTVVKHEPWFVDFDNTPGVKTDYDLTGLSLPSALHVMHRFPVEADYDIAGLLRGARPPGSEPLRVAFWVDGKQVTELPYPVPSTGEVSGVRRQFRTHVTAGEHWLSASVLRIYEGLPPSFHGPNPSTLPQPVGRGGRGGGGGRGGRGATPGTPGAAPSARPPATPAGNAPSNNDELAAANANAVFGGGAAVGFLISNLEVTGPYNQVSGPSKESTDRIFVCREETAACAKKIVATLAGRIYRRTANNAEVDQLSGLVAMVQKQGDSFREGLCLAIQRMLISPNFLFRIEHQGKKATGSTAAARPVSDFELATRLSYFLWTTTPDDELLRLAQERSLHRPDVLNAQVERMLKDPKSMALVDDFGGQWLEFRGLESHEPERKKFQEYTEYTRMSFQRETELFFESIVREDRPITDIIDAKYTFLNQRLAEFYGIPGVKGAEFRKVDLTGTNRQGVLTQASVLTMSSYANRTSPVLRGKWVLENLLNAAPPPPPPGIPTLDEKAAGVSASLREQLEKHRADAVCASCHSRMDQLGFALDHYDAIGRWRDRDGKFAIDASGQLPGGRKFIGANGLVDILMSDRNAFTKGLAEKMLTYALGRGLESYDRPAVNQIAATVAAHEYRFSSLVLGIVNSLPFEDSRAERKPALTVAVKGN